MRKLLYILFLLAGAIGATSCEEAYNPNNLDSGDSIPVVLGYITSDTLYVIVRYASPYNSYDVIYDSTALVSISDNLGNTETLTHTQYGIYTSTHSEAKGTTGRYYKLRVEMSNGNIIESDSEKLYEAPIIEKIFGEIGEYQEVSKNSYGDLLINTYKGIDVYANLRSPNDSQAFFRYSAKISMQSYSSGIDSTTMRPYTIYCWTTNSKNTIEQYVASNTMSDGEHQVVQNEEIAFACDQDNGFTSAGYIIHFSVRSIPYSAFSYYRDVEGQMSSGSKLFDPIPPALSTNLHCVNRNISVLGIFETSSVSKINYALDWEYPQTSVSFADAPSNYPDTSGCINKIRPDFWVFFNK
jgi:hypothetical protein